MKKSKSSSSKRRINNMDKKLVSGHGIYEKGKYIATINKKMTKEYQTWQDILKRCYSPKYHEKRPTYVGCIMCEEWIYFQDYAEWHNENYYSIPNGESLAIDKDILYKGNKIYSPETCIFVPESINNLLTKSNGSRGKYPIGVSYNKRDKKFISQCKLFGKQIHLGYYSTPEEAHQVYKNYKEKIIITTLERYKGIIPEDIYQKLYSALKKYKVEMED
jgi:hypothetical protein